MGTTLDDIKARGREIAEQRLGVTFRHKGRDYWACCPLHPERTPSFKWSAERLKFHCFPCKFDGSIIDLVSRVEGLSVSDVIRELGAEHGAANKTAHRPQRNTSERQREALAVPAPSDAGEPPKRTGWAARWPYTNAAGETLAYSDRIDGNDGKRFLPWRWHGSAWEAKALAVPRPLYGLAELARKPEAPVLVVEGEKAADAARELFQSHVCVTSSGGSSAANAADWTPLKGRDVTLWPDHDEPGTKYADDVATILHRYDVTVRIVQVPENWPARWDLADPRPASYKPGDGQRLLNEAKPFAAPQQDSDDEWLEPEPIIGAPASKSPFPVAALGELPAQAVRALVEGVEAAESLAANVVLSGINAATHAHADVETLSGKTTTLSLGLFTVAQSGDRKSECEHWVFDAARKAEGERRRAARLERDHYKRRKSAWKPSSEEAEPLPPPSVRFFLSDFTPEGLHKHLRNGHPAVAVLSAEAGRLTGGHSMSDENRRKTAAVLSDALDRGHLDRMRAGNDDGDDGFLDGRRVCMHLLIQPDGAAAFLGDPVIVDQGLGSRLLVAWPERPRRTGRAKMTAEDRKAVETLSQCVAARIAWRLPTDPEDPLRLVLPVIRLSEGTEAELRDYSAEIEQRMNEGGDLEELQRYINKTAEQATKIAASLFLFEGERAPAVLPVSYARRGIAVARWFVAERLRLFEQGTANPKLVRADKLLRRIAAEGLAEIKPRDVVGNKMAGIRSADEARHVLGILADKRWLARRGAAKGVGRPSETFEVRPDIREQLRALDLSAKSAKSAKPPSQDSSADFADSADDPECEKEPCSGAPQPEVGAVEAPQPDRGSEIIRTFLHNEPPFFADAGGEI